MEIFFLPPLLLFFLLAIRDWLHTADPLGSAHEIMGKIAGWEGIVCGCSAMYYGMAQVINEEWGRILLPVGAVTEHNELEDTAKIV